MHTVTSSFYPYRNKFYLENSERELIVADACKMLAMKRPNEQIKAEDIDTLVTCIEGDYNKYPYSELDPYKPMYSTDLYKNHDCAYHELLKIIDSHKCMRRVIDAVEKEWEKEQERLEEEYRRAELNSYLYD